MKLPRILLALALSCALPAMAQAPVTEQIAFASVRKVVREEGVFTGACSAVVIGQDTAYTAKHCLASVLRIDGLLVESSYEVPNKDMLILTVPGLKCPCVRFAPKRAQRGDRVYAVGFPFGDPKVTTRGEAQQRIIYQGGHFLVAVLGALPGMSGGGVFSVDGRLLGIISGSASGILTVIVEL